MKCFPEFPNADDHLHTVLDWVRWGASCFSEAGVYFGHGTVSAWDEAWYLVSWAIYQPWDGFEQIQYAHLTVNERHKVFAAFRQRVEQRVPAAYITGVAWFAGYPYKVTADVLVPRSPIAELILADFSPWLNEAPKRILDMCTGSGCIGIACAHQFAGATVDLVDISTKAVQLAEQNIAFHQCEDRIVTLQSDAFSQLAGQSYDLIVCNPPYVDAEDLATMPAEFHAEPHIALASGEDGLDFTRRLLAESATYLNDGGLLVVEVGNSCGALEAAYAQVPFTWPELENGGHGVFVLTKEQLQSIEHPQPVPA